ncbi:hypothetical protein [Flavobacterium ginsenosidimutans]|uniref:Bacteriophage lambda Replication protein O N-terminal domain-containing protein n=1 Tax=Flavobacterium ginsenosidimutans TaxID=687844 RepID=A0ABZ2QA66_9FLAO
MKENQEQNFVQVNYNLLATQKLNSTQKLFISYILGWQRTGKICFETNRTLASKFGMKYGGIRSVLKGLNRFDFFKSVSKDYDEKNSTSGHEITVNVAKLENFLDEEKPITKSNLTEAQFDNESNANSLEDEKEILPTYHINDIVDLNEILSIFNFNDKDSNEIRQHFQTPQITFDAFADYYVSLITDSQMQDYKGIIITKEQDAKFMEMCAKK